MIKFNATNQKTGRTLFGFGLVERNLDLLKAGKPISIDGTQHDIPIDIFIFYGKDEEAILEELKRGGIKLPEPKIPPPDGHDC